ncbi:cytochrome C [Desulfosediminicola sp.]|uniref:cytochrome C n=1 Tax=Desulfosediminicola sp. TaxID=2886825 RepID=UPI003AF30F0B
MLKIVPLFAVIAAFFVSPVAAEELTWRKDVQPMLEQRCLDCHGSDTPEYNDWRLLGDKRKEVGSRMDTYPHFMSYVVWPATGAMIRRLDDQKPGNMCEYLGDDDAERLKNLKMLRDWLGEGAWNLNRWQERDGVPGITKEQLEMIKAKY